MPRLSLAASLRSVWQSGFLGKLLLVVTAVLLIGMFDAAPRYVRFFRVQLASTPVEAQPIDLPPTLAQYTAIPNGEVNGLFPALYTRMEAVRDSLTKDGVHWANNLPRGYDVVELQPRFQKQPGSRPGHDSIAVLIFLDARLECDCSEPGNFRLVRFVVDPKTTAVACLRDQTTNWARYLSTLMPKIE